MREKIPELKSLLEANFKESLGMIEARVKNNSKQLIEKNVSKLKEQIKPIKTLKKADEQIQAFINRLGEQVRRLSATQEKHAKALQDFKLAEQENTRKKSDNKVVLSIDANKLRESLPAPEEQARNEPVRQSDQTDQFTLKLTDKDLKNPSVSEADESESEKDNYVELYVAQQMHEKVDPLEADLKSKQKLIEALQVRNKDLEEDIARVDAHYTRIFKTILARQGVAVTNLDHMEIMR